MSKIPRKANVNNLKLLVNLQSISPKIYEQLLRRYSFAKKLQSQTVIREKLRKTLLYEKSAHKIW